MFGLTGLTFFREYCITEALAGKYKFSWGWGGGRAL